MPKINQKIKQATLLVSILAAVVLSVFGYLFFGVGALDNFIFFSVVLAITPYAILDYVDYNWRKNVDAQLPELFRSIVQDAL